MPMRCAGDFSASTSAPGSARSPPFAAMRRDGFYRELAELTELVVRLEGRQPTSVTQH